MNTATVIEHTSLADATLVQRIAGGDKQAFELIYHRYERRAYGYIRQFVADRCLAEDVLVDTMVSVWLGAREFRAGSLVSTWILGIARHKSLDAIRRVAVRERLLHRAHALQPQETAATPADLLVDLQRACATRRAISRLSDKHYEVLRLAFYEDLLYEEISKQLGIPLNTVKTRIFNAKQQLRRYLRRESLLAETGDVDRCSECVCHNAALAGECAGKIALVQPV